MKKLLLVGALSVLGVAYANAALAVINVGGTASWDVYGDTNNVVMTTNIGAGSHVTAVGWDVTISTIGASWLEEAIVDITESTTTDGFGLSPGAGDDFSGTSSYSSGGLIDLVGIGFDFFTGGDGLVRMEFWESFDDVPNSIDANWTQGTITLEYEPVPEPGTMIALGLGASALLARRRRR